MTRENTLQDEDVVGLRPTSSWQLDYFERSSSYYYYTLSDEEGKPTRTIKGKDARDLKRILTCKKENIPQDVIDAFGPLLADAFSSEFDLSEEGEAYRLKLVDRQPKKHSMESEEEVYRRYWTGHLLPNGISANEAAEKIIKSEPRVRIALAWGDVRAVCTVKYPTLESLKIGLVFAC